MEYKKVVSQTVFYCARSIFHQLFNLAAIDGLMTHERVNVLSRYICIIKTPPPSSFASVIDFLTLVHSDVC